MNVKTIYLLLLVGVSVLLVFTFRKAPEPTTEPERSASNTSMSAAETKTIPLAALPQPKEPIVVLEKPVFATPITPRVQELRKDVVKPVREMKNDGDMVRMGDAMGELARMRTIEATNVLAELLFANKAEYYRIRHINGVRHSSYSYRVMGFLYRLLEGTPEPLDGAVHHDADLPIFQDWWMKNKDNLVFRDPNKPAPMPRGMKGK